MTNLTDKIASVLRGEPASADVSAVLEEAKEQLRTISSLTASAKATSLDPVAPAADVKKAREQLDDLAFQRDRLTVAVEHLQEKLTRVQVREREKARSHAYEAAVAERDAVAMELQRAYPEITGKLIALLQRLEACDAQIAAVNQGRPDGMPWIEDVESLVRGRQPNGSLKGGGVINTLARSVRLPLLDGREASFGQLWPQPPRPSAPVTVLVPRHVA